MAEYFDVLDESGVKTGQTVLRSEAHEKGIPHGTVHIWIVSDGMIFLQKRAADKDSFPNQWDISSAGHIPAGESADDAAVRELYEELGISVKADELNHIGRIKRVCHAHFHGKPFNDIEFSEVYLLNRKTDISELRFTDNEVQEVRAFSPEQVMALADDKECPIAADEAELIISNIKLL